MECPASTFGFDFGKLNALFCDKCPKTKLSVWSVMTFGQEWITESQSRNIFESRIDKGKFVSMSIIHCGIEQFMETVEDNYYESVPVQMMMSYAVTKSDVWKILILKTSDQFWSVCRLKSIGTELLQKRTRNAISAL